MGFASGMLTRVDPPGFFRASCFRTCLVTIGAPGSTLQPQFGETRPAGVRNRQPSRVVFTKRPDLIVGKHFIVGVFAERPRDRSPQRCVVRPYNEPVAKHTAAEPGPLTSVDNRLLRCGFVSGNQQPNPAEEIALLCESRLDFFA